MFFTGGLSLRPSVMLVMTTSLRQGFRTALIAAVSISTANLFWLLLAVSGTAALAIQFETAFLVVKLLGLVFVGWIAWNLAFKTTYSNSVQSEGSERWHTLFGKGLGLPIANPKVRVFFWAILPQFVDT